MSSIIKKNLVIILIIIIVLVFFWPIFRGSVPIPFDGLVGAYFPWLDFKYGYVVGVPVKNISVTDVFSQLYPWRLLVIEAFKNNQFPLWNPYSFSGTPLLANWQSAALYPLNILMIIFGNVWGWTLMIVLQPFLSIWFMFLFLKQIKIKTIPSLVGGIVFAFSGFMTTFLEYGTAGQVFLWLPLQLYLIEKFFKTNKPSYLIYTSLLFFLTATGGSFQPALYVSLVVISYFFARLFITPNKNKKRKFTWGAIFLTLSGLIGAVQLLPTMEFVSNSIRQFDHNISEHKFGLLPVQNLITLLAPDFFGNPSTQNFWGFLQYQETHGYFSIIALALVLTSIIIKNKSFQHKFFLFLFFLSLVLAFNNPLSALVYKFNLPGISTGYASRWFFITGFAAAVLTAISLNHPFQPKKYTKFAFLLLVSLLIGVAICLPITTLHTTNNTTVALRNSILPLALITTLLLLTRLVKNKKLFLNLILILITLDLFRAFSKFTPFSPTRLSNLDTPITKFIKADDKYYRLDKEEGPLMPSNTWTYSNLYSPSGYDPLIYLPYATWYRLYTSGMSENSQPEDFQINNLTRYLNLNGYSSPFLDLAGVKYLLTLKRTKIGEFRPFGEESNYLIPKDKFTPVFEDETVIVLENKTVMPRVILYDSWQVIKDQFIAQAKLKNNYDFRHKVILSSKPSPSNLKVSPNDSAEIIDYSFNQVNIKTQTADPTIMVLTDTEYPGWQATIDGNKTPILTAQGIYRAINLPAGNHIVSFQFKPKSFYIGLIITLATFTICLILLIYFYLQGSNKD